MADLGPWITAAFDSDCDGCGAYISEGDEIRADGEGGWLCQPCGDNAEEDSKLVGRIAELQEEARAEARKIIDPSPFDVPPQNDPPGFFPKSQQPPMTGGQMAESFEGVAGATIVVQMSDASIDRIADRIIDRLVKGMSPESLKQYAAAGGGSGLDEFAPDADGAAGGEEEDPWAADTGTTTARSQRTASSAASSSPGSASSARPASGQSSDIRQITLQDGRKQTLNFDPPNGPTCNCGDPAVLVVQDETATQKGFKRYCCAKSYGDDWSDKCEYNKFLSSKRGGRR